MASLSRAMSEPPKLPRSNTSAWTPPRSRATRRRTYSARETPSSPARRRDRRWISGSSVIWVRDILPVCHHAGMDLWALSDLSTPWCVHVVATLRIADHILAGNAEIDQLAAAAGADRDSLYRVLRHLVSKGMFEEPAPGRFALNEAARALLENPVRLGLDLDAF